MVAHLKCENLSKAIHKLGPFEFVCDLSYFVRNHNFFFFIFKYMLAHNLTNYGLILIFSYILYLDLSGEMSSLENPISNLGPNVTLITLNTEGKYHFQLFSFEAFFNCFWLKRG